MHIGASANVIDRASLRRRPGGGRLSVRARGLVKPRPRDPQGECCATVHGGGSQMSKVEAPSAPGAGSGTDRRRPRRSAFGRVASRMLLATVLYGSALAAYLAISGQMPDPIELAERTLERLLTLGEEAAPPAAREAALAPQRATLFEEDAANPAGRVYGGRASWRTRSEAAADGRETVAAVEVEIPARDLVLALTLRRETGAAISHLLELRFTRRSGQPNDSITAVAGLLMKKEERAAGIELAGRVAGVGSGVFLMGLSAADADLRKNLSLIEERDWLDVAIVHKDHSRSILAIEKGAEGQRVIRDALEAWERERPQ
jgi:hypothetical protein